MRKNISKPVLLLLFIFCSALCPLHAQKEGNIWYFGKEGVGLDFNQQAVKRISGGKLVLESFVEPFVMADPCGNLLFYSDGFTVWNKDHEVMQNGENLFGSSSGQAVVALPHPGNSQLYFLFTTYTTRLVYPIESEIRYSVIDMEKDNGQGEIISKNNFLYKTNTLQITGIRHADNRAFWLVTSQTHTNNFLSFLVGDEGLQSIPVVSTSPYAFTVAGAKMRASPDGRKIAVNSLNSPDNESGNTLFLFNNGTGKIEKAIPIKEPSGGSYLVEFSPDSKKLYWAFGQPGQTPLQVAQYRLDTEEAEAIYQSKFALPASAGRTVSDMRLGPDGRIYLPYGASTDVIVNPNATGEAVQYQKNAVAVNAIQLPNNIAGFTIGKQKDFLPAPLCTDSAVTFKPQVNYRVKQWQWNFGDQASGSNNTSTEQQPVHQFSGPGTYQVRLVTLNVCNEYDTVGKAVTVYPDPVISLRDTVQVCYTQAPVPLAVTAYPSTQYRWSTGDTTALIQATQSGWYTVKAYNPCNARQDSLYLSITPEAKALLPDDTVFCEGSSKVLDAGNAGAGYEWSTGETTRTIQVYQPGTYWVRIRGGCNVTVDTSNIVFVPEEVGAFIPNVFTPNGDGFNDTFYGFALNTPDYRMSIYNRWGEALFHSADPFTGWDGRNKGVAVPPGIYYYLITATDCSRRKVSYKGYVSLLR